VAKICHAVKSNLMENHFEKNIFIVKKGMGEYYLRLVLGRSVVKICGQSDLTYP
jgi:hypothetical protein